MNPRGSSQPVGPWDRLVVYAAGTSWDGQRGTDQHMAEQLARHMPVLYVDPPRTVRSASRVVDMIAPRRQPLRAIAPQFARLTPPGLPRGQRAGIHACNDALVRRSIRAAVRVLGGSVVATVACSLDNVFDPRVSGRRVLYGTDDYVAGAALMGIDENRLRREERAQLARADRVVTVSDVLAERWRAFGAEPVVIPNGVDAEAFAHVDDAPLPNDVDLPSPIAGFVGFVSDRIDFRCLDAVAERGRSLLLVGPAPQGFRADPLSRLLERPNVRWVGAKPFAELPRYLRAIDVGLTPYAVNDFNRASSPLKTLEYLAAGRAAVATDLPAIRSLDTDLVTIATAPPDFGDAVEHELDRTMSDDERARRRAFAQRHGWAARAAQLVPVLAEGTGGSAPPAAHSGTRSTERRSCS